MEITPIARIKTNYPEKFGIPRQSGLVETEGLIVFEPAYSDPSCIRGLEGYDYLWLIWRFDHGAKNTWSPTVRPPILGGNTRVGVFATRSPFRPNPLGLSSVKLKGIETVDGGLALRVVGADLRDGTEIYDIKPYLPYADCHEGARAGFAQDREWPTLAVDIPEDVAKQLSEQELQELTAVLELDPRPAVHHDPQREYGMAFVTWDVAFMVDDDAQTLHVKELRPREQ